MPSQPVTISKTTPVTDIVLNNYRTADIFLKYDIEFCCGGKWPLEMVCTSKKLDVAEVIRELERVSHVIQICNSQDLHDWSTGFLIDFIINVYHKYLRTALPIAAEYITRFIDGHLTKFPGLQPLQEIITKLHKSILLHITYEEEALFPYISQITNAHKNREPYAGLLVKTLRKPLQENEELHKLLLEVRTITSHYAVPINACVTHRVSFSKLQELDENFTQYLYLENEVLFPKVLQVEKELLA